jgi:8-oxo-dGTP pyrophosphatase MutT (NUDIX family)
MFNEIHYRDDKILLDFENGNMILRNAVRAIIKEDNKLLMAYLKKTGEYKFPGGGKEKNETTEEALKREVLEEVGYNIKKITEKAGTITEYAIAKEGGNNIFKMISEYYMVEIEKESVGQNLEEYEKKLMFRPCWVEIEKAYKTNSGKIKNKNIDKTGGINRETIVLGIIRGKL